MAVVDRPGLAWVTGASSGIGRALVLELASRGWTVLASARSADALRQLALAAHGRGPVEPLPLDITDPIAIDAAVKAIASRFGRLDLAILNAGTHRPTPADDFRLDVAERLVTTNLLGTIRCLHALLPDFLARKGGEIAVVASQTGYRGLPTASVYGATKAALINLCESLRPELEQYGVSLRLINPGFVDTPLTRRNTFRMPFLISAEASARQIIRGLAGRRFEVVTPRRMAFLMRVLRLVPNWAFLKVARRITPAPGGPSAQRNVDTDREA